MSGQKITISEPSSKWSDVFPQDNAPPPAPLKMTGEIKAPFDQTEMKGKPHDPRTKSGAAP